MSGIFFFFYHSPPAPVFAPPRQTTGPILVNLLWQLCHMIWVWLAMMRAFATVLGLTFVKRTPWARYVIQQSTLKQTVAAFLVVFRCSLKDAIIKETHNL